MSVDDPRIAWLIECDEVDRGDDAIRDCLSAVAAAGFRALAMELSMATVDCRAAIESEAKRRGLQVVRLDEVVHCRLAGVLGGAERWATARELSKSGFEGYIICGSGCSPALAGPLYGTARALLRDVDQLNWESYH